MRRFLACLCGWLLAATAFAGAPTFDERVEALRAVKRTYHERQAGTRRSFDEALPAARVAEQVRRTLQQSAALERIWNTPLDVATLEREWRRIVARSHAPEHLHAIEAALGGDPHLILEVVARPVLAARLASERFAFDPEIHRERRAQTERLRERIAEGVAADGVAVTLRRDRDPESFDALAFAAQGWPGGLSPLEERTRAFVVRRLIAAEADRLELVEHRVTKRGWDDWWSSLKQPPTFVAPSFDPGLTLPGTDGSGESMLVDDTWADGNLGFFASKRDRHRAVWSGSEMIVWGDPELFQNDMDRLVVWDPVTNSWREGDLTGAPAETYEVVWSGSEMIVCCGDVPDPGARYDPATDAWSPISTSGHPGSRSGHVAVWSGSEMIVWSGDGTSSGARYDPATDSWAPTSTVNAPSPRQNAAAVWTGAEMIVWGGSSLASGGRYDPASDSWAPISTTNAPSPVSDTSAVWSGTRMIVWPGADTGNPPAHLYDPATDTWTVSSSVDAPSARTEFTSVWSGDRMIVWGGGFSLLNTGAAYDPATDSWSATSLDRVPRGRRNHTSVWSGTRMIVFGGRTVGKGDVLTSDTGGRYDPVTDSWLPLGVRAANGRAVWSGNQMLVWGSEFSTGDWSPGERYDAALAGWVGMNHDGAPTPMGNHTAVWTGDEMIVFQNAAGGRYDPLADAWSPVSATGAPTNTDHAGVWTGSEMIVWGGEDAFGPKIGTGARYNPATDAWSPVSTAGAPTARDRHSAVWTGSEMIVWGGSDAGFGDLNDGGRYDPAGDLWTPTSTTAAPAVRRDHGAVWTGGEMIVWGGRDATGLLDSGGRYDPAADAWTPTSLTGAPAPRSGGAAIWTGGRMVVFAGSTSSDNTGGRYDPVGDAWTPTSTVDAPGLNAPFAVWTGDEMIVFDGDRGGRYAVQIDTDSDGVLDQHDCAPWDATAFAIPAPAGLSFATDKQTLSWDADSGGSGTVHDVLRGALDDLPVGGPSESCLASGLAASSLVDTDQPASAAGFRYLVRGTNACGTGDYGDDSAGTERTSTICP